MRDTSAIHEGPRDSSKEALSAHLPAQILDHCHAFAVPLAGAREERVPSGARCAEKACIYPAVPGARGVCLYHDREEHEPVSFRSHQPSQLLLEHAKFGLGSPEFDHSRAQDRRRLATLREDFLAS